MNKKRVFLLCGFIIMVVILMALYINTDFLKTKEQLFWKYFSVKKDSVVAVFSNNEAKEFDSELKKSSYIKRCNLSVTSERGYIGKINAKIFEAGNKNEDCKNIFIDAMYKDTKILDAQIIKDENYYFFKTNQNDTRHLAFENANLKQFAQKMGLQNVDFIPDKIKELDFFEWFSLTDEETKYISKKYIPICREYVKNSDYSKTENKELTIYELQLSKKQMKNLVSAVLDELYNDEYSLNILANKAQIIYCNTDNIKAKIGEIKRFVEEKNDDDEKFLSIIIYRSKSNVEKIEFVLKNDRTISIENESDKIIIKQFDVQNRKIEIDSLSHIIETILNSITEVTYKKNITDNQVCKVEINVKCNFGIEAITINYNYEEDVKEVIDDLTRKNDIDYVELTKNAQNIYEMIIENITKINLKVTGKNY